MTELLSGELYQPLGRSSSHQIWSSAMVVTPALRGLFGLDWDALHHTLRLGAKSARWVGWRAAPQCAAREFADRTAIHAAERSPAGARAVGDSRKRSAWFRKPRRAISPAASRPPRCMS